MACLHMFMSPCALQQYQIASESGTIASGARCKTPWLTPTRDRPRVRPCLALRAKKMVWRDSMCLASDNHGPDAKPTSKVFRELLRSLFFNILDSPLRMAHKYRAVSASKERIGIPILPQKLWRHQRAMENLTVRSARSFQRAGLPDTARSKLHTFTTVRQPDTVIEGINC